MELEKYLIEEHKNVTEAMSQMDESGTKNLFVHENGKLLASISDGDIRRWILKNGSLLESIKSVANYEPKYLVNSSLERAKSYLSANHIVSLPIVDNDLCILSVVQWDDTEVQRIKSLRGVPVVIMAGGLGTRLYPYTKILPKPLIPVGDIPITERIMDQFYTYGCTDFYLIVNHKKNMIKAYFNDLDKPYTVFFIDEEQPLGTGGGVGLLKGHINSTFVLTNCDIIIDHDINKIYEHHNNSGNIATMVCSLKKYIIPYGVVKVRDNGIISSIEEKPQYSFLTNTGCYFIEPQVIDSVEQNVPISMPDVLLKQASNSFSIGIYPISENSWHDMGQIDEYQSMSKYYESQYD